MSQVNRRFASIFVVFAAIIVYHFSVLLAVAILVIAVLLYQGFQMSDLRANVTNINRAQGLVSSLYSWTESAVSSVVQKCKRLTVSGGDPGSHSSTQNLSNRRRNTNISPDSENIGACNRENIYKDTFHQGHRVGDKFPKVSVSNTLTSVAEWNRKSPNTSGASFNKSFNPTSRYEPENENLLPRGSPWGYSLTPQQRSSTTEARSVQGLSSPLLASSRYNTSRDSALYVDVNSPGFSSRLLKYHSEAAIHQPQYARPGQLPLVHLNTPPLPTINARNSQKVRAPVRVRIAPPTYGSSELRLFSRPEKQPSPEHQAKSVIDALKEISRKRIHSEDGGNEAKRHHRSDSSSSSSSSSSPAMVNGVLTDQVPTGKRPREEDSPKQQKSTVKRTRNNEIYSSLSSSRNINIGTKRKAADSWSRCSTPTPIGKHLKKSPHQTSLPTKESEHVDYLEHQPSKQPESQILAQQASVRKSQLSSQRNGEPPKVTSRQAEAQPSSSHLPEEDDEESVPKTHPGRLFVKAFSRRVPTESETMKGARDKGAKPWKTQRTIDADAITGEDIVEQELELGSRRLNSMFSVLQSNASPSIEVPKADVIDGALSKPETSKPSGNSVDGKGDAVAVNQGEKSFASPPVNLGESVFSGPTSTINETVLEKSDKIGTANTEPQPTIPQTFGSVVGPSSNSVPSVAIAEDNGTGVPSSQAPVSAIPSAIATDSTVIASPVGFKNVTQASSTSLTSQSESAISQVTSAQTQLKDTTQTISSTGTLGIFGNFNSGKPVSSTFTVTQPADKLPITTNSAFAFGASGSTSVISSLAPSSGFGLPSSSVSTSIVSSVPQPVLASPFSTLTQTSASTANSNVTHAKSDTTSSTTGGFSFGATTSVTPSSSAGVGGFSIPKMTSSTVAFGMGNSPSFATTTTATSLPSAPTLASTNPAPAKPFSFGSTPSTITMPTSTASSQGGFNFQSGSGTQSSINAPKPQEASGGFKFSFGGNKEEVPTAAPVAKPPTFGEGFAFGANSASTNAEESKSMTFGTPTDMTPTLPTRAAVPTSGGFNFSADVNSSASIPKPTFGFGTSSSVSGIGGSAMGSSGGFSFGAKPAEPSTLAPAPTAPSMVSPFQFGGSSSEMQAAPTLQQPQAQTVTSPFSIGGTTEQKPPVLGGGFSFGSTPSASITPLQQNTQGFGQASLPTFGSPTVNPLQSQQAVSPPSLFQFGSGGNTIPQPGMSSGGFNFGGATVPGAPPSGFNFNATGPSATTPFQFGANPLQPGMQAPAMFSIGSGSTAPRSRPRIRRLK